MKDGGGARGAAAGARYCESVIRAIISNRDEDYWPQMQGSRKRICYLRLKLLLDKGKGVPVAKIDTN